MKPWLRRAVMAVVIVPLAALVALALFPPDMLRIGAAYTAKLVCSGVFVGGREPDTVVRGDVHASGPSVLRLFSVSVDREARTVRTGVLGFIGGGLAVARDGTGCAIVPDGDLARARAVQAPSPRGAATRRTPWPEGDDVGTPLPALQQLLRDPQLGGPGVRAVVVLHRGRIVAEHYAAGFGPDSRLLGWSMAKSVNAALVGTAVAAGRLAPDKRPLFAAWAGDARRDIGLEHLLSMSDGLDFEERYDAPSGVTRMLYLEPDMASYAVARPAAVQPGQRFNYASGSSVLLARLWQDAVGAGSLAWPRDALFAPLGMTTAVFEADARGNFVGSSYLYASGRDWARFALLLLQDGRWHDQPLLPPGWVQRMLAASPPSKGEYTQGQLWQQGPGGTAVPLPADTRWMRGFDGQSVTLVPSRGLAVVRLGVTPKRTGWQPEPLVQAVLAAIP